MSKPLDYLRLMRVSLLPTVWADVLMAFLLSTGHWQSIATLLLFLLASSCFYCGGMVLNDLCDLDYDRQHNPQRALPSGNVAIRHAWTLFGLLFGMAFLAALLLHFFFLADGAMSPLPMALALAACIVVYDAFGKRTALGPLLMGGCRTLNILFVSCVMVREHSLWAGFSFDTWMVALTIGIYVAGITWFARKESRSSNRLELGMAALVMGLAVGLLMWLPFLSGFAELHESISGSRKSLYLGLLAIMVFPVLRRVLVAVSTADSGDVKSAVIVSLLTIIMIDASICYLVSHTTPAYALTVAALVVPSYLAGRRIMST